MVGVLTVADAAGRLGVSPHEVRRLLHAGVLTGRRLGRQLIVDEASVDARSAQRVGPGRALTPANAWGVLFELSREPAPWLAGSTRSRLLGRWMREADARAVAGACRRRATHRRVRILPAYRDRLLGEPGVVLTGMNAAASVGADVVAVDPVAEMYCSAADLEGYRRRFALSDDGDANLLIRVPAVGAIEVTERLLDRGTMPLAVVAADLMESDDPRTRRAGQTLLQGALDRFGAP